MAGPWPVTVAAPPIAVTSRMARADPVVEVSGDPGPLLDDGGHRLLGRPLGDLHAVGELQRPHLGVAVEGGAHALAACYIQLAAKQAGEVTADREAQPRAAVAPRRIVLGLCEGLEHPS